MSRFSSPTSRKAGLTIRCSTEPSSRALPSAALEVPCTTTFVPTSTACSACTSWTVMASPVSAGAPTSVTTTLSLAMMFGVVPCQQTPPGWLASSSPVPSVVPWALPIVTPLRRMRIV